MFLKYGTSDKKNVNHKPKSQIDDYYYNKDEVKLVGLMKVGNRKF